MVNGQHGWSAGGRRRRSKKHRRTRRGGFAPASFRGAVEGMGGQPAGPDFGAVSVSGPTPNTNASNYGQATAGTYASYGGRRRSRRSRKTRRSRRHRMRGGGGTGGGGEISRIFAGYQGDTIGPAGAIRVAAPAGSQG